MQRNEEFVQALIINSTPKMAKKLYESANLLDQDLTKIIKHGQYLDTMRCKRDELAKEKMSGEPTVEQDPIVTKPIMMVRENIPRYTKHMKGSQSRHEDAECQKCGRIHEPRRCPAFRTKCFNCDKVGHFEMKCRASKVRNEEQRENVQKDSRNEAKRVNQVHEGYMSNDSSE